MAFDHEKLDVYRLAVRFSSWVGERLEGSHRGRGRQAASGAYRIDALAHDRKPAIASGPQYENEYEHDCEPESEHEHEHESRLAEA